MALPRFLPVDFAPSLIRLSLVPKVKKDDYSLPNDFLKKSFV